MTKREHLNPPGLPDWSSLFSQAVSVDANGTKTVYVSGQVGVTTDQALWGDGSLSAQTRRAFHNLSVLLAAAGCTLEHVVKLTVYVVGYPADYPAILRPVMHERFPDGRFPALSLIGVEALARPEFAVEIEAVAVASSPGEPGA